MLKMKKDAHFGDILVKIRPKGVDNSNLQFISESLLKNRLSTVYRLRSNVFFRSYLKFP